MLVQRALRAPEMTGTQPRLWELEPPCNKVQFLV